MSISINKSLLVAFIYAAVIVLISVLAIGFSWGNLSSTEFASFISGITSFYYVTYLFNIKNPKNEFSNYRSFALFDISVTRILYLDFIHFIVSKPSLIIFTFSYVFCLIFYQVSVFYFSFCFIIHYLFSNLLMSSARLVLFKTEWNYMVGLTIFLCWLNIMNINLISNSNPSISQLAKLNPLSTLFYSYFLIENNSNDVILLLPGLVIFVLLIIAVNYISKRVSLL